MSAEELVREHVRRLNEGVRTGDFGPMIEGFTDDAELTFEGVAAGPFAGRSSIEDAYRSRPDDEIEVLWVEAPEEGRIVAAYSWGRDRGRRSGDMVFTVTPGGLIARLVVKFADQAS